MMTHNMLCLMGIICCVFFVACINVGDIAFSQEALSPVKIFGVTEGSLYTEFVKPIWYEEGLVKATLRRDSATPKPFVSGQKITENGSYQLVVTKLAVGGTIKSMINFVIDSALPTATIYTNINNDGVKLKISFKGGEFKGHPMYALWAEDLQGNFIRNLFVSAVPATNIMRFGDNFKARPQGLPYWAHKTCPEKQYGSDFLFLADPSAPIPDDLDAVTGATQKVAFDIKTKATPGISAGKKIKIYFEVNQSFDWGWYFHYDNATHEEDGAGRLGVDKYFSNNTGCGEPSLVYMTEIDLEKEGVYFLGGSDSSKKSLPIGYGHYAGRTGKLYTDFFADHNGVERFKFDHAHKMVGAVTVEVVP